MNDISARRAPADFAPELLLGLRELEGRFPTNELAARIVRAAMAQPGISGARLWRIDRGSAEVWAQQGMLPAAADRSITTDSPAADADPTLWTAPLGSDDFRARVLEVRSDKPIGDAVRAQLDVLARFGAVVLALAERRGAMAE